MLRLPRPIVLKKYVILQPKTGYFLHGDGDVMLFSSHQNAEQMLNIEADEGSEVVEVKIVISALPRRIR
jgi:hypothetical protein